MSTEQQLTQTEQRIHRLEQQLASIKLKERKQETRRKIELGGLVVKAKLDRYPKAVILGALLDALQQLETQPGTETLFHAKGEAAFMGYGDKSND